MHDYSMLSDRDRLIVAVSGGIDSLVLTWILFHWQKKAPISFSIEAVHIDMDSNGSLPGAGSEAVKEELAKHQIPLTILPAVWKAPEKKLADSGKNICFQCARARRTQLFSYARDKNKNVLALGHHKDDIIETFLMNITCSGNISTMKPKQDLFDNRLSIIRPMAYCEKEEIQEVGRSLGFSAVRSSCPLSENTRREDIHQLAQLIYKQIPGARDNIFAAMANVRTDYLLKLPGRRSS